MTPDSPSPTHLDLSVVIPAYNSAPWLPSTIEALASAVRAARLAVEVVVVDDGSTDGTAGVVAKLAPAFPGNIRVLRQDNRGRFLARWEGIRRVKARRVLLLDSRVLLADDALAYVFSRMVGDAAAEVWNAHVTIDPRAPLVGFFWEVPTHIFWGRYLRSPRPFDLDDETFDAAPKGTGVFLAPRDVLEDAFEAARPEVDARLVSDDTKVLRRIAHTATIRLDPGFSAVYRPRTSVRAFVRHTFDRGTLFVDSYAGTSAARSALILALVVAPIVVTAILIWLIVSGAGAWAWALVALIVVLAAAPLVPAALNRCPPRGLASYVCCLPIFVGPFWLGLLRGVSVHRRAFLARSASGARLEGDAA